MLRRLFERKYLSKNVTVDNRIDVHLSKTVNLSR